MGLSVLLLSGHFLGVGPLVFSEFKHGPRSPFKVVYEGAKLEKLFCPKNWGNEPKIRFFESNEKFGHYFSLNFFYNENILFAMFCTILMYGKNLFSEIWAKMLSVSQTARFLNQIFLQNKSMN